MLGEKFFHDVHQPADQQSRHFSIVQLGGGPEAVLCGQGSPRQEAIEALCQKAGGPCGNIPRQDTP